jgi:hypothetical protein
MCADTKKKGNVVTRYPLAAVYQQLSEKARHALHALDLGTAPSLQRKMS